jgi:acyl-CoA thioester hydrolase
MTFEQHFQVGWSHLDSNAHMANTAYLDLAANVRVTYLAAAGFSLDSFARNQFGPVIRGEELEYFRELRMMDRVRVSLLLSGLSEDASRFRFRNEFWREDGTLAAQVNSLGGWIDLRSRQPMVPPADLGAALEALDRTSDFDYLAPRRVEPVTSTLHYSEQSCLQHSAA